MIMMNLEICKWFNNAASPFIFMIDDLANVWVDFNNNGVMDLGEDWGYFKRSRNSSMEYLENVILKDYPNIKVTFFVPVGIREGVISNPSIPAVSKMINVDEASRDFFKSLYNDPRYELAYHGTTHGKSGKRAEDFIQEWELFENLEQAIETIEYGKGIFMDVCGEYPKGGKYCGYKYNKFSDESIEQTGFLWWCRNMFDGMDVSYFGKNNLIDIPATVSTETFNFLKKQVKYSLKYIIKRLIRPYYLLVKYNRLKYLSDNKLVISIYTHISPARVDGLRQKPNIFDDCDSIKRIFNYFKGKNVWYCTCSELSDYIRARNSLIITEETAEYFQLKICSHDYMKNEHEISLLTKRKNKKKIIAPDGTKYIIKNGIVNIKSQSGKYYYE
jgi:hypothetical protein